MDPGIHLASLRLYSEKTYAILDSIKPGETEDELCRIRKQQDRQRTGNCRKSIIKKIQGKKNCVWRIFWRRKWLRRVRMA